MFQQLIGQFVSVYPAKDSKLRYVMCIEGKISAVCEQVIFLTEVFQISDISNRIRVTQIGDTAVNMASWEFSHMTIEDPLDLRSKRFGKR